MRSIKAGSRLAFTHRSYVYVYAFAILSLALICSPLAPMPCCAQEQESQKPAPRKNGMYDDTTQFIFYSVLEGLYEDGVSTKDVDQILLRKEKDDYYIHFIYACPICTSTIWALEAYQSRPKAFYRWKSSGATFGRGLSEDVQKQLHSGNVHQRLAAINGLIKDWLARRMDRMNLTEKARTDLLSELEKKRKQGMNMLQSFRTSKDGKPPVVKFMAPAYVDVEECAACNGAVGKGMKLPDAKQDSSPSSSSPGANTELPKPAPAP